MTCRDIERLATAYVDGELDERRSSALRGHLRTCAACAERVEDEARLRDAAGDLGPAEPPPGLWQAIDARLAEEEIQDARRSRIGLWWQRAVDAVRTYRVPVGVGAVAVAALVAVWVTRGHGEGTGVRRQASGVRRQATAERPAQVTATVDGCGGAVTHDEEVLCQMQRADRRYLAAIAELEGVLGEERALWSAEDAAHFDGEVARLDRALEDELKRLAVRTAVAPGDRDSLHGIYQQKIDLLSRAVVAGDPRGAP